MKTTSVKKKKIVYVCLECCIVETKETTPFSDGCTKYKFHRWREVGEEGNQLHHCNRCGIMVKTSTHPDSRNCPTGGLHQWIKI